MIFALKRYSSFSDWNIDMLLYAHELKSTYCMIPLGKIILPRKERLKATEVPDERLIVNKIRFSDGKVFFKDRALKNDMNRSCVGDLLVSNINFEKGAFAVNTFGVIYASTDYTSYIIDEAVIIPEFLVLVLRCRSFMEYITSVKPKGMKTRARYEFIKQFEIPVPSIPEQKEILGKYHATLAEAEDNIEKGNGFSDNLLYDIQARISDLKKQKLNSKASTQILEAVPFSALSRWEVSYIHREGRLENVYSSFKYPVYSISELQKESLFGLSIKASLCRKRE